MNRKRLLLLLVALLALTLAGTAAVRPAMAVDPFEPNNTQATSTLIEPVAFIGDAAIDPPVTSTSTASPAAPGPTSKPGSSVQRSASN